MTHASLFSGIGGFDLAAEWMGWSNVFSCEIDPFCRKVLAYHFPKAKQYEDVKTTDFAIHRGHIDVLTGGFPCQPFSLVGKRKGSDDNRYLWPEMLRAIREIRPRWVVGENVLGIVNWSDGMVFEQVQSDLENEGYEVQPLLIPACAVDAPHRRDRVWFVAHRWDVEDTLCDGFKREPCCCKEESYKRGQRMFGTGDCKWLGGAPRVTTYCNDAGTEILQQEGAIGICESAVPTDTFKHGGGAPSKNSRSQSEGRANNGVSQEWREPAKWDSRLFDAAQPTPDCESPRLSPRSPRQRKEQFGRGDFRDVRRWDFSKFPTQSPVCSRDDGLSDRLDSITFPAWRRESIKAYGNAVVPQIPYLIFETIEEYEKQNLHQWSDNGIATKKILTL